MSQLTLMRAPQKYVQGKGALLSFCKETEFLGERYLFVCSNSGYKACHDQLEQSFEGSTKVRHYEIFGGISSTGEIEKMREIVKNENIDVIVGVGGGSAIDTAKATAHYEKLPVAIVPTVVATDAPCTGLSVIYNNDGSFNSYLFYPKNPEAVIVDSQVVANAPVSFLVSGMGDALGTYFEARACDRTHSLSLEFGGITRSAMALCRLCFETLVEYGPAAKLAVEKHVVTPALEAVIEANVYLSGVGADNGGLGVSHSFYNGLTSLGGHAAPHGDCVAFGTLVQLLLEHAPMEEFEQVQDFCASVGLPVTLEQIGITTEEQIQKIAEASCVEGETLHNLAGDVTPDQLHDAIVLADALGQEYLGAFTVSA